MKVLAYFVIATSLVLGAAMTSAQENSLVGRWQATDPQGSGEAIIFTFTEAHIEMAGEEPVAYRAQRKGNTFTLFVEGQPGAPPSVATLVNDQELRMQIPDGPEIFMSRVSEPASGQQATAPGAAGPVTQAAAKGTTLIDEITSALLPHGVPTRLEPLGRSLDQLLTEGWILQQISAAQGGFTAWLTSKNSNAVCIVLLKPFDDKGGALSDCRRLN